jgi:hypothetical protein
MSPRASTLQTPTLLATPWRAQAIGSASPPLIRWFTSHEHTPGASGKRLRVHIVAAWPARGGWLDRKKEAR